MGDSMSCMDIEVKFVVVSVSIMLLWIVFIVG